MNGEVIWLCHAEVQIHAELSFFSGFDGTVLSKFEDPLGRYLILKTLSFFVVGRLGRKEKRALGARWEGEREKRGSCLFPLPIVPGALSIFSITAIGIISWSLCGGESPEGGDQGQIVCAENIYAPTKDNDIINFLNNLRTILQKENLDDEENIILCRLDNWLISNNVQDSITVTTMQSFPWILILVKTTLLFSFRWR